MAADYGDDSQAFHRAHDRLYGYALGEERTPVELVNIRLVATGIVQKPALSTEPRAGDDASSGAQRRSADLSVRAQRGFARFRCSTATGCGMAIGLRGPAVIETVNTTIIVSDGFRPCRRCGRYLRLTAGAPRARRHAAWRPHGRHRPGVCLGAAAPPQVDHRGDRPYPVAHHALAHPQRGARFRHRPVRRQGAHARADRIHSGARFCAAAEPASTSSASSATTSRLATSSCTTTSSPAAIRTTTSPCSVPCFTAVGWSPGRPARAIRPTSAAPCAAATTRKRARSGRRRCASRRSRCTSAAGCASDVWDMIFANIRTAHRRGGHQGADRRHAGGRARLQRAGRALRHRKRCSTTSTISSTAPSAWCARRSTAIPDGDVSGRELGVLRRRQRRLEDEDQSWRSPSPGSDITFDFTGSSPQTPGFVNAPYSATASALMLTFLMLINPDIPHNAGLAAADQDRQSGRLVPQRPLPGRDDLRQFHHRSDLGCDLPRVRAGDPADGDGRLEPDARLSALAGTRSAPQPRLTSISCSWHSRAARARPGAPTATITSA